MRSVTCFSYSALAAVLALNCAGFSQNAPAEGRPAGGGGDGRAAAAAAKIQEAASKPTPKSADGHPDLTGFWTATGGGGGGGVTPGGEPAVTKDGKTVKPIAGPETQEHQGNLAGVARRAADTGARPSYKAEFTAKAEDNFVRAAHLDPSYRCMPLGVPRLGPPQEIVQTPKAVYLFYQNRNTFRIIPADGRQHDKTAEAMANGDAIGSWEGDTFVIETVNFNEDTWLDGDGSFHTPKMKVTERFTRQGNSLKYEVTVDDPAVMAKAWNPRPRTMLLGKSDEHVGEDYPCVEMDQDHLIGNERH